MQLKPAIPPSRLKRREMIGRPRNASLAPVVVEGQTKGALLPAGSLVEHLTAERRL